MGVRNEHVRYEISVFGRHALNAFTTAFLLAEFDQIGALNVTLVGDSHHHILFFDQIFVIHVTGPINDLGAPWNGEFFTHFRQLVGDDRHNPFA